MERLENRVGGLEQRVSHLEGSFANLIQTFETRAETRDARAEVWQSNTRTMLVEFRAEILARLIEDKHSTSAA